MNFFIIQGILGEKKHFFKCNNTIQRIVFINRRVKNGENNII